MVWLCKTEIYWKSKVNVYIKTNDIFKVIGEDVDTKFGSANNELDRPVPKGK